MDSIDLSTTYLGLQLANPLVASAGPRTGKIDSLLELADHGIAAVVLPSLFEEQIEHFEMVAYQMYEAQADGFAESPSFLPDLTDYNQGPDGYLDLIAEAKKRLSIPVIASLNGISTGGWTRFARQLQDAGADALELNIYYLPIGQEQSSLEVEQKYIDVLRAVKDVVRIPVAVKFGPFVTNLVSFTQRLSEAGADGLVMFNRYLEPDLNLETLRYEPRLELSQPYESRLSMRWIALLRDRLSISIAASSGINHAHDMVKLILAGADVTMITAVLMRKWPSYCEVLLTDFIAWLEEHGYSSVKQMRGSMSYGRCPNPAGLLRANYIQSLHSYSDR